MPVTNYASPEWDLYRAWFFAASFCAGRITSGRVSVGDKVKVLFHDGGAPQHSVITKIMKRAGMEKIQLDTAMAGDVVSIAGKVGSMAMACSYSPLVDVCSSCMLQAYPFKASPCLCSNGF